MNKISKILLILVVITFLFAGVAAAVTEKFDVKDSNNNVGPGMNVIITHDFENNGHSDTHECKTDEHGQCEMDGVENGEAGIYYDKDNQEHYCHVEDVINVPEFPKVALPIAATIGLVFFFQQRNKEE